MGKTGRTTEALMYLDKILELDPIILLPSTESARSWKGGKNG